MNSGRLMKKFNRDRRRRHLAAMAKECAPAVKGFPSKLDAIRYVRSVYVGIDVQEAREVVDIAGWEARGEQS